MIKELKVIEIVPDNLGSRTRAYRCADMMMMLILRMEYLSSSFLKIGLVASRLSEIRKTTPRVYFKNKK